MITRKGKFLSTSHIANTLMLGIESPLLDACIEEVIRRKIPGVFGSSAFSFSESSLDFFPQLPPLRQIWLWDIALTDVEGIYSQPSLSFVGLHGRRPSIDFTRLPAIRTLSIDWHQKDFGIQSLQHVKEFFFWHHKPRTKTFRGSEFPPNLELLKIYWSNAIDLDGLPVLPHVKRLEFHRCRNLRTLDGIDRLFPNTEKLIITTCGRLEDISAVEHLKKLQFASPDATTKSRKRRNIV